VQSLQRNLPANMTITSSDPIIFNSRGQAVDVDDIMSNLTISLIESGDGGPETFASGTLLGTGVFSYD